MVALVGWSARVALLALAACYLVMGRAWWLARGDERFLPDVWPIGFAAVGVGMILLAIRPTRRFAIVLGAATFAVTLSRTAAAAVNIAAGDVYANNDRATAAFGIYPALAGAVLYVFRAGFGPWASIEELQRRRVRRH